MSRFTKISNPGNDDQLGWHDTVGVDYDPNDVQISGVNPRFGSKYFAGTTIASSPSENHFFVGEPWLRGEKTWMANAKFSRVEFPNWNGDTLAHVKVGLELLELNGDLSVERVIDANPTEPTITNYRDAARFNKAGAPGNNFQLSGPDEEEGIGDGLADSGRSAWARITDAQGDLYGLIQFGDVFVPQFSCGNQIYAIDAESGAKLWEKLGWQDMPADAAAYCEGNPEHKYNPPWAVSPEWWSERYTSIGKVGDRLLIHRQRFYWSFENYSDFFAHPVEVNMSSPGRSGHPTLPDIEPSSRHLRFSSWQLKWWTFVIGGGSVELLGGDGGDPVTAFGGLSSGYPNNVVVNEGCGNSYVLPNSASWEWEFQDSSKVAIELADMDADLTELAATKAWRPATCYKVEHCYELLNPLTGAIEVRKDLGEFSPQVLGAARLDGAGIYEIESLAGAGSAGDWRRLTEEDHEPQTARNLFAPVDKSQAGYTGGSLTVGLGRTMYLFYTFADTSLHSTFVGPCQALGAVDQIWVQMANGQNPWTNLPEARTWTAMHVVRLWLKNAGGEQEFQSWRRPLPWHSGKMATSEDGSRIYFFPRAYPQGFLPLDSGITPSNDWQETLHQIACFDAADLSLVWAVDVKPHLGDVPTGSGGRKSTYLGAMLSNPDLSALEVGGLFIGAEGEVALKFDAETGEFLESSLKLEKELVGTNPPPLVPSLISGDSEDGGCWWDPLMVVDSRLLGIKDDGFWQTIG